VPTGHGEKRDGSKQHNVDHSGSSDRGVHTYAQGLLAMRDHPPMRVLEENRSSRHQ